MHPADVSRYDGSAEELFAAEPAPKAPPAVPSSTTTFYAIYRLGVLFLQVPPQRGLVRVVLLAERALERRRPLPALQRDVGRGAMPPVRRLGCFSVMSRDFTPTISSIEFTFNLNDIMR